MKTKIPEYWATQAGWCGHVKKRPTVKVTDILRTSVLADLPFEDVGFITSDLNDICIIDADDVTMDKLPPDIQQLAMSTYTEASMSGTGLHIVFRLKDKQTYHPRRAYLKTPSGTFKGQLALRRNFMVTTGKVLTDKPLVELSALPETFAAASELLVTDEETLTQVPTFTAPEDNIPKQTVIRQALQVIRLDQGHLVKRAYQEVTGQEYEHYTFWLTVGMALHSWGQTVQQSTVAYAMFLDWSKTDPTDFTGEAAVEEKWRSFSHSDITYKTILALAARLAFDYPRREMKEGKLTPTPQINEYCNFEYLLNRYNLKLHESDGFGYYLSGDRDILDRYFKAHGTSPMLGLMGPYSPQALQACTLRLCQDSGWRRLSSTTQMVNVWMQQPQEEIDMLLRWLDTPEDQLEEQLLWVPTKEGMTHISKFDNNSNFDYVEDCITWNTINQPGTLSRDMLYKTFMQLIKFRTPLDLPFDDNGGMLAFLGPENTRKTTFFKMLLPKPLAFLRKEINMQIGSDKGIRDFLRYLGRRAIVQIDEFEGFMDHKKAGSLLKAIISGNDVSITDIYKTEETVMPRRAIIVGTSNETRHVLSQNGSRRMWLAEVLGVDTDRLLHVNWHRFYNTLRAEFKENMKQPTLPWLMTQEQVAQVSTRNKKLAARTDLDIVLEDLFPYNEKFPTGKFGDIITNVQKDDTGHLHTTTQVMTLLRFHNIQCNASALERALERFCMEYLDRPEDIQVMKPKCLITHGQVCQGNKPNGRWNYKFWILPKKESVSP